MPDWREDHLRRWVVRELKQAGFQYRRGLLIPPDLTKEGIRRLHLRQRAGVLTRAKAFIEQWEDLLIKSFADGTEVYPEEINPEVVQVTTDEEAALFRYASLQWSVPVSQGYGRRTRFLVMDRSNDKLIGIFALGDPVFNLRARDNLIGWDHNQRSDRLYNVLDAYVCGAVSPYRELIGGKLVAMAATCDTTLDLIAKKYRGNVTVIRKQLKSARPVLITTTSSLGRSSIYNRLRFRDHLLYRPAGWTEGYGHFQFSEELFDALTEFARSRGTLRGNRYGCGPNWRMRTLRTALTKLDLDDQLVKHGIKRQVYLAPVARNWREYLRGERKVGRWYHFDLNDLAAYHRDRWAEPRAQRDPSYLSVEREALRLSSELA